MVNRYDVLRAGPQGEEGELLATAQQKRMAFREQVAFSADADRTQPVFGFVRDSGSTPARPTTSPKPAATA